MKLCATLPVYGLLLLPLLTSCAKPTRIIIGSKASTEQRVLAEITAQHIERNLGDKVRIVRRLDMGDTNILNQALINGDVDIYPEDTGLVITQILHETATPDPAVTLARAKAELARIELLEMLDPLGFDNRTVIVVSASTRPEIKTISQAAAARPELRWNLATTLEFVGHEAGMAALNAYHLAFGAAPRTLRSSELFPAMEQGNTNMTATQLSDPYLLQTEWRVLEDDLHVFPPRQTALVARQEVLRQEPQLRAILTRLSGAIDLETMRRLNAQVDLEQQKPADVAAKFLDSLAAK